MQRHELEHLDREELIALAERLSVPRPRVLTQPELIDEILTRTTASHRDLARARGWFGRARDLLASVVERGLHLPEVARVLRATPASRPMPSPPPPLATVTLAEIYAAQGHLDRAITVLDEVLSREPAHEAAHKLRDRFFEQTGRAKPPAAETDAPPARREPEAPVAPAVTIIEEEAQPHVRAGVETPPEPLASADTSPEARGDTEALPDTLASAERPPEARTDTEALPETRADTEALPRAVTEQDAQSDALLEGAAGSAEPSEPEVAQERSIEDASAASEEASEAPAEAPADVVPEPLPARYNVDEVVAIAVDPATLYFYWEVRPTTLARIRAAKPSGALIARLVSVAASWQGPQIDQRDIRIDLLFGDHTERGIASAAHVRVSIGWLSGTEFDPIAIGTEVEVPRALPVESVSMQVGQWTREPGGLPLRPAADYGLPHAMLAAAQGPIGHLTRMALAGLEAPLHAGALPHGRMATDTGSRQGAATPGGAGPFPHGGSSDLSREGRAGVR